MIDEITLGNVNQSIPSNVLAAKKATCAQVEFWMNMGEEIDIIGSLDGFSLGSFSVSKAIRTISPRAQRFLFLEGLLYRGVKGRKRSYDD